MMSTNTNFESVTCNTPLHEPQQHQAQPAMKKRSRGRRRKTHKSTTSSNNMTNTMTSGYVSESSSEQSKCSITQKKSKAVTSTNGKDSTAMSLVEQSQYLALDCEMVGVGIDGQRSTLARVTIVNWDGHIVYDQLIHPTEPVTDYRTFVSGISPADYENNDNVIDFQTCRTEVLELLQDKILIGHALKNDLSALQIKHPWQQIRDTAKYEPFMKQRFEDGIYWPRKLKDLVYEHVNGMIIQQLGQPHSAYEDAYAAMLLYQSVRNKWEKVMTYKIRKTAQIEEQQKQQQQQYIGQIIIPSCDESFDESIASVSSYDVKNDWPKLVSPIA